MAIAEGYGGSGDLGVDDSAQAIPDPFGEFLGVDER